LGAEAAVYALTASNTAFCTCNRFSDWSENRLGVRFERRVIDFLAAMARAGNA